MYLREAQSRIFRDMHSKYFPRGILQTVRKASEYMLIKLSHLQIFYILRNKLLITNQFNRYILRTFQPYHNINRFLYSVEHDPYHMVYIFIACLFHYTLFLYSTETSDIKQRHQRKSLSLQQRPFYCGTFKDTCPCLTIFILTDKP